MTIYESWSQYLDAQKYAPNTIVLYGNVIREFMGTTGKESPTDVTADDVEAWMILHKNWSDSTKKYNYAAMRRFFMYLVNKKLIADDPTTILPAINMKHHIDESVERGKEDKVYSPEELIKLIEFADLRYMKQVHRDKAIIALMAATGMRGAEVCWLNIGQIRNRKGNEIFARRKGQNIRRIVVADFAFPYLDAYIQSRKSASDDDPLFLSRDGNRLTTNTLYCMLASRQKRFGLRTGTHNIRYTVLNAVERAADPVVARDIAGQKSISVTNGYMVSNPEERAAAIATLPWANRLKK